MILFIKLHVAERDIKYDNSFRPNLMLLSLLLMLYLSFATSEGMLPLWMFTLGQHILGSSAPIPYLNILITLSLLIIPLFVGMLIAHFLPRVSYLKLLFGLHFLYP